MWVYYKEIYMTVTLSWKHRAICDTTETLHNLSTCMLLASLNYGVSLSEILYSQNSTETNKGRAITLLLRS